MTTYILVQLGSAAVIVLAAVLALRRYKRVTDAAVRSALAGMDATAAAALSGRNIIVSRIPEPGLNGHHAITDLPVGQSS